MAMIFSFSNRRNIFGKTSSALPHIHSTFLISFNSLFILASSIASAIISTPTICFAFLARPKPIVPVPQQISKTIVFSSMSLISIIFL